MELVLLRLPSNGLVDRSRRGLRAVTRRALWLVKLDEAFVPQPTPAPYTLPARSHDAKRRMIDRSSAQVNNQARVTHAADRVIIESLAVPASASHGDINAPPLVVGTSSGDHVGGTMPVSMGNPGLILPGPPPGAKPRKAKKMSKEKQELSFEGEMPIEKIITYLRGLSDGLAEGTVPVESGLERVVLEAAPSMTMKIKAKVKKRDNNLKIELAWTTPEGVGLKIGNGEADE